MKHHLRTFLLLLSSLLILPAGNHPTTGCADDGTTTDDWLMTFFSPNLSQANEAFYLKYSLLNPEYNNFPDGNILEWKKFCNDKVDDATLNYLIYQTSQTTFDSLVAAGNLPGAPTPDSLVTLKNALSPSKYKDVLRYLQFAKACEPIVAVSPYYYYWEEKPKPDTLLNEKLLRTGLHDFSDCKNNFLRQRYGFQIQRLYFFSGNYEKATLWYDEAGLNEGPSPSIIVRSAGYNAGAYYRKGDYKTSDLLYARLFNSDPGNETAYMYGFQTMNDSDWLATVASASTDSDKVSLWTMYGYHADPLRAMQEIYQINPNASNLRLMLVRAINTEEQYILNNTSSNEYWAAYSNIGFDTAHTAEALTQFTRQVCSEHRVTHLALWTIAQAHLEYMRNHHDLCKQLLETAKSLSPTDDELFQIRITSLLNFSEKPAFSDADEEHLCEEVKALNELIEQPDRKQLNTLRYVFKRLAQKYAEKRDYIKAELCCRQKCLLYSPTNDFHLNNLQTDQLLALMRHPSNSNWTTTLLQGYQFTEQDLVEWQAIRLAFAGKAAEALRKLKETPGAGNSGLYADPFLIHTIDCHDCDFSLENTVKPTKLAFVERINDLVKSVKTKDAQLYTSAYLLGNAFYNMSYYGNARAFYTSAISADLGYSDGYGFARYRMDASEYYFTKGVDIWSMEQCVYYYNLALAAATTNEQKAEISWMLAKCELNDYFTKNINNNDMSPLYIMGPHAVDLRDKYHQTAYYKEVIRECDYFRRFVSGR